ncbi:2-hydroxychromene-2-carboxylate isomerase [Brevundimonas sp.]|uniref:2-hydroxychromene-2-carboxylate isomerase n=1 Tax=Brevundimonas sp. TaxID=1871086 RepID=UPI0027311105|nr:2-hydroxychromene-2-carboxylate isomerase [Brevundimonas sp.]MDP1912190.1 2-hydroxychromene-2-carboxylate isomerase [Brevundimonas sp.]
MPHSIDYYLALQSPWTYLGHERFVRIAAAARAPVHVRPMDLGKVFPVSGGLPLPKRAPQRQAYRLVELQRFSAWLGLPLNLQPKFFPVSADDAARLVVAVDLADGAAAALQLSGRVLAAVWVQERDIASAATLAELLAECGLPAERLAASMSAEVLAHYERCTQQAIDAGVFGSPSYVVEGEIFWGQDRLDFLERRLARP